MNTHVERNTTKEHSMVQHCQNKLQKVDFKKVMVMSLIIGVLLTGSNQYSAVFGSEPLNIMRLFLAFITPFLVIMLSQMSAIDIVEFEIQKSGEFKNKDKFLKIMFSHNIPLRSLLLSFFAGSINSFFILLSIHNVTGNLDSAPITPMVQSYILPLIVGLIVQTLTYKKFTQ